LAEGNNSVFANPIAIVNITPNRTAERLENINNKSFLPFPFIFSPSRKNALNTLLPLPPQLVTVIEGFSQVGKSNFACNLSLIYKLRPYNNTVIYISNMGLFNENPCEYVFNELFYWFYEEIAGSAFIQNVLEHYFAIESDFSLSERITVLDYILIKLRAMCKKEIILIVDQFNLIKAIAEQIFEILKKISCRKILVTTNTDKSDLLKDQRRGDGNNAMTIVLDEVEQPISREELIKVVIKLFFQEDDKSMEKFDFAELLCNKAQNNLSLIFLFYNHYRGEVPMATLIEKYEEFADNYISENLEQHKSWFKEICPSNDELKIDALTKKIQEKIIFLNYDEKADIEDDSFLDKRYLYLLNDRLKSINPLITKMFQNHYGMVSVIEKFLNEKGTDLTPGLFGSLFDYYICGKFMQAHSRKQSFELKIENYLGDKFTIRILPKIVKNVHYGTKNSPNNAADCAVLEKNECITFEPITSLLDTLFKTEQSNFPFFDLCYFDNLQHFHNMINFKTNDKFMQDKEFWDKLEKYFDAYGKQAQKQIDCNLIVILL
jgi:hypothetical protein